MDPTLAPGRRDELLRHPDAGPRPCFFTGGTALRPLATVLKTYTHRSIHLVTPFDSGGSSRALREAFCMFAVGDVRNRMLSLADRSTPRGFAVFDLLRQRLPEGTTRGEARGRFDAMKEGLDPFMAAVQPSPRARIAEALATFSAMAPEGFDYRGASIGNLVLAALYLAAGRDVTSALDSLGALLGVEGTVAPVCDTDHHLAAELADGSTVVGQHRLTGKEVRPLESPIERLFVTPSMGTCELIHPTMAPYVAPLVESADLVVYPMGSFHTSLLASLLPRGVGRTIARASCPKVYVPNTGTDPEELGLTLPMKVARLLDVLLADCPPGTAPRAVCQAVLVDDDARLYGGEQALEATKALGLDVLRHPLVTPSSSTYLDARLTSEAVVALADSWRVHARTT